MAIRSDLEKDELLTTAVEMGLTIPENANVKDLRNLIEHSDVFKNDTEFVLGFIDTVADEKKRQVEKLEWNKKMLKIEVEIEKIKAETQRVKAERAKELRELKLELEKTELDKITRGVKTVIHPVFVKSEERECEIKFESEKIKSVQLEKVNTEEPLTEIISKTMYSTDSDENLIDLEMDSKFHRDGCEKGQQGRLFSEEVDSACCSNEKRLDESDEGLSVVEMGEGLSTGADMVDLCLVEDRMSGGCEIPTDNVPVLSGRIDEVIEDNLGFVADSVCEELRSDVPCLDSADYFSFRVLRSDCCERDELLVSEGQNVKKTVVTNVIESRWNPNIY